MIREKIYELPQDEIPYHTAVLVREYKEKTTLVKIVADIIVHRETQKAILIGDKGSHDKKDRNCSKNGYRKVHRAKSFSGIICKSKTEVEGE